jgi:hypothetical protein
VAHGQHPLITASDLLSSAARRLLPRVLDAVDGKELWRFQTGASISSGAVTYTIGSEPYVAVLSAGPASVRQLDHRGRHPVGLQARRAFKSRSGSSEEPTPAPLAFRRPVGGTAARHARSGEHDPLARSNGTATSTPTPRTGAMVRRT